MVWRFISFLLFQVLPALAAWVLGSPDNRATESFAMAMLGGTVWFALDALRGARLLVWLRKGDTTEVALGAGLWGEVFERFRRLVRARDRRASESEDRLQDFLAAFQASPNGVVLLEADGRIEWFNQTAANHFGLDARRDMQQHFGNLVRDPSFAAYFATKDFSSDVTMPGRENSISKPVTLSVHMHPYGKGRNLLLSRDITAIEQADAMRRDFVANVSHEIRSPLTVMSGFVETLQSIPLEEQERQRYLHLMSQQAQRMQSLVNDLLTLSRLEGSPLPSPAEWVPAASLFRACEQEAHDLSRLLWNPQHQLEFLMDEEFEISGSMSELHSALSNLVGNAVRYTPAGRSINVHWKILPDGRSHFSVSDDGPGIAPEHMPRLTERFYRVDRSRSRDTGGTGLGLAIVKHVVHRHGAELGIDSVLGQGSTFSIAFPAARVRLSA